MTIEFKIPLINNSINIIDTISDNYMKITKCIPNSKINKIDKKYVISGIYSYGLVSFNYMAEILVKKENMDDNVTIYIDIFSDNKLITKLIINTKVEKEYVNVTLEYKSFGILGKVIEKLISKKLELLAKCILSTIINE